MAKDLSIILEDRPGEGAKLGEALGKAGVNIEGFCATMEGGKGTVHVLVDDVARATAALEKADIAVEAGDRRHRQSGTPRPRRRHARHPRRHDAGARRRRHQHLARLCGLQEPRRPRDGRQPAGHAAAAVDDVAADPGDPASKRRSSSAQAGDIRAAHGCRADGCGLACFHDTRNRRARTRGARHAIELVRANPAVGAHRGARRRGRRRRRRGRERRRGGSPTARDGGIHVPVGGGGQPRAARTLRHRCGSVVRRHRGRRRASACRAP